jgi:hypothetical protein
MSTLRQMTALYVTESDNHVHWDEHLGLFQLADNSFTHAETGFSPFFLVHGHEPNDLAQVFRMPVKTPPSTYRQKLVHSLDKAHRIVQARNLRFHISNAIKTNSIRQAPTFQVGSKVLPYTPAQSSADRRRYAKFVLAWKGPYTITTQLALIDILSHFRIVLFH